jgi:hypothetical protein
MKIQIMVYGTNILEESAALSFMAEMKTNVAGSSKYTNIFTYHLWDYTSRDSSVGIATGYRLDDQGGQEFESQ